MLFSARHCLLSGAYKELNFNQFCYVTAHLHFVFLLNCRHWKCNTLHYESLKKLSSQNFYSSEANVQCGLAWSTNHHCSSHYLTLQKDLTNDISLPLGCHRIDVLRCSSLLPHTAEQLGARRWGTFDQALHWSMDPRHGLLHRTSRSQDLRSRALSAHDYAWSPWIGRLPTTGI